MSKRNNVKVSKSDISSIKVCKLHYNDIKGFFVKVRIIIIDKVFIMTNCCTV